MGLTICHLPIVGYNILIRANNLEVILHPANINTRYLLILILLLLGFALRITKLGDSAIWWDEAWSIWVSQQPFEQTTHLTASDVHPPLYQWALHVWVRLAGISAFSARYLSLITGLLTIATTYAIAKRLGGKYAGLTALILTAISPFFIHWSQEARMYAQAGLFTALTVYAYLRVRDDWRQMQTWLLLVIAGASVPLTQYLGVVTLGLVNLHLLLTLFLRIKPAPRPFYQRWMLAMTVIGVILGAWLTYAVGLTRSGSAESGANPAFVFQLAAVLWSSGTSLNITDYQWAGLAFVVVYSIGLLLYIQRDRSSVLLIALFALTPPLMIYLLGILDTQFYAPKPEERYFIIFAPVVFVGTSLAISAFSRLSRWAGLLALCAVIISYSAGVLRDYDRRYLQDDYLTLFDMLDTLAQPNEPVFFISDDRYPLVYYHLNRRAGWETPLTAIGLKAFDESALQGLFDQHQAFWVVFIEDYLADPEHQVMAWFDQHHTPTYQTAFSHNRVLYYGERMPQSATILSPPITEARPNDVIRAGGENLTISLHHHDQIISQQITHDWDLAHFTIYPAYPSGRYTIQINDQSHPIHITHSAQSTEPKTHLNTNFGDLTLRGYTVKNAQTTRGGRFEIVLHWQVNRVPEKDYSVFAQLIGSFRETGPVWANDDGYPAQTPASQLWQGLRFDDVRRLDVPEDMPSGTYEAYFGLYLLETGERLTDQNGADIVAIGGLQVK